MTEPSLQQLPSTWDVVAPTYAQALGAWMDFAHEALRLVPVAAGQRVLDVACGSGAIAFEAAKLGAEVDAVDFSPGMIQEVTSRAERERITNIRAAVMDAQSLAFADATFDVAFCLFAYFFFPDRARAFSELYRVTKPAGRACVVTWGVIARRPAMKIAFEAMAEALPNAPLPSKGDLQDPSECIAEMSAAGFRDVRSLPYTGTMRFESVEHYFESVIRSTAPFAVMKQKLGAAAFDQKMSGVLEALRKRFPESGELSAEALITIGTR